jgi:hypothetical protein
MARSIDAGRVGVKSMRRAERRSINGPIDTADRRSQAAMARRHAALASVSEPLAQTRPCACTSERAASANSRARGTYHRACSDCSHACGVTYGTATRRQSGCAHAATAAERVVVEAGRSISTVRRRITATPRT